MSRLNHVALALSKLRNPGVEVPAISRDRLGREVLTASAPIGTLGWLVFVDLPFSEALQPIYDSLYRTIAVLAFGLAFAVLAGIWFARRMVVPIRALAAGAARIGGGDLDHRIKVTSGDEVESLADSFNEMGGRLKESYATLEHKVEVRTRELTEALEQQTATAEVLGAISSSQGELQPVFKAMLENAVRICGAKFGNLWLCEGDRFRLVLAHNAPPAWAARWEREPLIRPEPGTALGRIASTKQVVHIEDVRREPAYLERETLFVAQAELAGGRTLLVVPMLKEDELVGSIGIYRQEVRPFTDKQIELLETFADQAVIAIENTRLFEGVARPHDRAGPLVAELKALGQVSQAVNSSLDLQTVLSTILGPRLRDVRYCRRRHLCARRGDGRVRARGRPQHDGGAHGGRARAPDPPRRAVVGECAERREAVQIADLAEAEAHPLFDVLRAGRLQGAAGRAAAAPGSGDRRAARAPPADRARSRQRSSTCCRRSPRSHRSPSTMRACSRRSSRRATSSRSPASTSRSSWPT